jgi:hypothetical protein
MQDGKIIAWGMPLAMIGGSSGDVLAVAMTEDGHRLYQNVVSCEDPAQIRARVLAEMDSHVAHERFKRRFPGGYDLEVLSTIDPRVREAVKLNASHGEEGDRRL